MPRILARTRLVPNVHVLEVHAPEVARACRAGQFVIVMPDERGERIPLSVAGWDAAAESVTVVFTTAGTSTRKLALLEPGDEVAVFVGPLGRPAACGRFGTVLLVGGCFGIGAIRPIAAALREDGNRVLVTLEAKSPGLVFWRDRLRQVSDAVSVAAREVTQGLVDFAGAEIRRVLEREGRLDRVVAIGCPSLMHACAEATRPLSIPTAVQLTPIMLDGTGMCGACRVSVGGTVKFACVDGPEFDGHAVDWEELFARRAAYVEEEVRSFCAWEKERFP